MLDLVTCSMTKPLQAVWRRCHTSAASTKHLKPCPSCLTNRMFSFSVSMLWRVFLPAPQRVWECPRCLGRLEHVHTEGHGQNKEGKICTGCTEIIICHFLIPSLSFLLLGDCVTKIKDALPFFFFSRCTHHTDVSCRAHNDNSKRCLIYSECGLSLMLQISPSMLLCCPAGFLRSPISQISITEP